MFVDTAGQGIAKYLLVNVLKSEEAFVITTPVRALVVAVLKVTGNAPVKVKLQAEVF